MAIGLWKLLGAGAVMSGTTALGRRQADRYRRRPLELRRLAGLLRAMRADIAYLQTPLPDAFDRAGDRAGAGALRDFFAGAARRLRQPGALPGIAVSDALSAAAAELSFTKEDRDIVKDWCATVGTTGRDEQLAQLDAALALLEAREVEALADRARYEKVYQTAGVLAGLLIVILLI
jgi:stage III sporulation protein AB